MDHRPGTSDIRWPDFVIAPAQKRARVQAAVCPVVIEDAGSCFAVTLDHRWLCGSEGELTFFDSMAAASRFLQLMKVGGLSFASPQPVEAPDHGRVQCFRLSSRGLTSCARCRVGKCAEAQAARDYAQQHEAW